MPDGPGAFLVFTIMWGIALYNLVAHIEYGDTGTRSHRVGVAVRVLAVIVFGSLIVVAAAGSS